MDEKIVLCGANFISRNIILIHSSRHCRRISVRNCRLCVYYLRRDVGGILTLEFDKDGNLEFQVSAEEGDYLFDEIGSGLKIRQYQLEKKGIVRIPGVILPGGVPGRKY